jgi:hypothetical protein
MPLSRACPATCRRSQSSAPVLANGANFCSDQVTIGQFGLEQHKRLGEPVGVPPPGQSFRSAGLKAGICRAAREAHLGKRQKRWLSRTATPLLGRSKFPLAAIVSTGLQWRARRDNGEHLGKRCEQTRSSIVT